MQINTINVFSSNQNKNNNPQFKSAYPVYHWVKNETTGKFEPAVAHDLNKKLQRGLVRLFNGTSKFSKTPEGIELIEKLAETDFSYGFNRIVRSYYDKKGGWKERFRPINYLITGGDVDKFDKKYGEPIGKASAISPRINGRLSSAELTRAVNDYMMAGLNFVRDRQKQIVDTSGNKYGLHTKVEEVRNSKGKFKEYRIIDIKFCPETGAENPFVRTGYYDIEK